MLHNTSRETLLATERGATSLLIDALYHLSIPTYHKFTYSQIAPQLLELGLNPKLIRAGLSNDLFSPVGLRNTVYTLPAPSTVRRVIGAAELGVRDSLPAEAFKSLQAYRQALHSAFIERRPGQYSRHLLARRLGVCKRTTANYDRRSGHKVTPDYDRTLLTAGDLMRLVQRKKELQARHRWLAKIDQAGFVISHAPPVRAIALKWLSEGYQVMLIEQKANYYAPGEPASKYAAFISS